MRGLTIGQLAETAAANLETIRYYERIGLMPEPGRTSGGHRSYGREHARRFVFIRRARGLGFSIEEIRTLLELAEPGHSSCGEVKVIAARHLQRVRSKLSELAKLESTLAETIDRCVEQPSLVCPILDILDPDRSVDCTEYRPEVFDPD